MLTVISERQYQDSTGLIWELQPHSKNIFHQPGPDLDQIATRSGPDLDQIWNRLGPDLDPKVTQK